MGRRFKRRINNFTMIAIMIILILLLGGIILYSEYQDKQRALEYTKQIVEYEEKQEQQFLEDRAFEYSIDNLDNLLFDGEMTVYDSQTFFSTASYNELEENEVQFTCNADYTSNEYYYILRIIATAETECAKIRININNGKIVANYPIYTDKTEVSVPIPIDTKVESVELSLESEAQKIYLTGLELVDSGVLDANNLRSGVFLYDTKQTNVSETDKIGEPTKASVVCGNHLYSVYNGKLSVYKIFETDTQLVTELSGIGNAVDVISIKDGDILAITSRTNGAYFVDISNPVDPVIVSHYDTLELATGISAYGNYVFICSRYFGIEILDVSDPQKPQYISQIYSNGKEYFSCDYYNGYLYISAWGQQEIDVYDLIDYDIPRLVRTIEVDGNPGDITVQNGCLFVATGYHSQNVATSPETPGYGLGNGMEIYDLTEPSRPKWLSTSKIDGRYRYSGNDFWKIKVSEQYAVLASTYNGMYVYDVTQPSAPKRLDHVTVRIEQGSDNYKKLYGQNYVFSWDTESYFQEPILSIAIANDYIYFGGPETGLYKYHCNGIFAEMTSNSENEILISEAAIEKAPKVADYNVELFTYDGGAIYSSVVCDKVTYVGTSNGILLLDDDLNVIELYPTAEAVKDLAVSNDGMYLYSAESESGIAIYENKNKNLTEVGRCKLDNYDFSATSLMLLSDESTLIAQVGFSNFAYIDLENKRNPLISSVATNSSMYYRNLAYNLLDNENIIGYDNSNYYIFSPDTTKTDYDNQDYITINNPFSRERDGLAVLNNYFIAITNKGYVYFNPLGIQDNTLSTLKTHNIANVTLHGKANVDQNNYLMVVSDCFSSTVTLVDLNDLNNPKLISQFTIEGNPDVADFSGDCILIPLRRAGLLKLTMIS